MTNENFNNKIFLEEIVQNCKEQFPENLIYCSGFENISKYQPLHLKFCFFPHADLIHYPTFLLDGKMSICETPNTVLHVEIDNENISNFKYYGIVDQDNNYCDESYMDPELIIQEESCFKIKLREPKETIEAIKFIVQTHLEEDCDYENFTFQRVEWKGFSK